MKLFRSLLLVPVLLAACGGGGAATQQPGSTGAATGLATQATNTSGPAATGTATGTWCLNTPPEVEAALHVTGVVGTSTDNAGSGGGCIYTLADGTPVHSVAVVNIQGFEATYEAGKQTPGVVQIADIGKGALLMSSAGPLVILTDKGLISMGPLGPADIMSNPAAYRTAVEALGRSAVGRLP
jgi:hypothetical protein